jgi:hypothetical protein
MAQQAPPAASAFSFAVVGDTRPMMYLPYKEGQPELHKLFVEMFGLVMPEKAANDFPADVALEIAATEASDGEFYTVPAIEEPLKVRLREQGMPREPKFRMCISVVFLRFFWRS